MKKIARVNIESLKPLEKFIGSDDNPKFFFTMTEINKIGINPGSKYDTPLGVYAYPLTKDYYNRLLANELPTFGNQPYINVFTLNVPTFNMNNYSESQLLSDTETIKIMYGVSEESCLTAFGTAKFQTPICKLWNLTRLTANGSRKWASILRSLGYTNFYDQGNGVIHPAEPNQAVILDTIIIVPVETYLNPHCKIRNTRDLPHVPKEDAAIFDKSPKQRFTNLESLDQKTLFNILMLSSPDEYTQRNIIKLINDEDLLKNILLNKKINSDASDLALAKIKDENFLINLIANEIISNYTKSTIIRHYITSKDVLEQIALNKSINIELRMIAASSLMIEHKDISHILSQILKENLSQKEKIMILGKMRQLGVRGYDIESLIGSFDKDELFNIITESDNGTFIIELIKDANLLERLAIYPYSSEIRVAAIRNITDQQFLKKLLKITPSEKYEIVKRIKDEDVLKQLAHDSDPIVRFYVVLNTESEDLLFKLSDDRDPAVKEEIITKTKSQELLNKLLSDPKLKPGLIDLIKNKLMYLKNFEKEDNPNKLAYLIDLFYKLAAQQRK